ncbi:MAG TPA: tyrosine--tRNA ligase [Patescibacteria group bacterium]|nr:tyrosine--tRNA ligase [Patescibacteria group bacterium]
MTLSEELAWRGFINQSTLADIKTLDKKKWTFYHGYDASSDSLTIGNLAALMFDRAFVRHGHKAIMLAGGATSLIGDPGGKNEERPLQPIEQVEANVAKVKQQIEKLFGHDVHMANNLTWFKDMPVLTFLRDVGKHFSMTPLVQRDYIAKRLGEGGAGISYTEISYTLLQGYDFLHLHKHHEANLQLAGSDQWGNCLSGVELVRKVTGDEVHAITMPLIINKTTGIKFGKSEGGAVWLDPDKTSPIDFYQFWINVDDDSVGDYLKIFTELDKEQIAKVMEEFENDKPNRHAQKTLAYEVTKLVHGAKEADNANAQAVKLGQATQSSTGQIKIGDSVVDVLVKYGLGTSKTEARQLLSAGGVYINNKQSTKTTFEASDFQDGRLILRRGKTLRNTVVLRLR